VLVESREAIGARVKSHLRVALLPPRGRTRSSLPSPSRGSSLLPPPACGGGLGRGSFGAQTPRPTRGPPPSQPSPAIGGRHRRWPDASPGAEACVTGEEGVLVESREAIGARVKSHLRVALLPPRGRTRSSLPSPSRGSSLLPPPPAGEGWGGGRSERKHHAPLAVRPHPNLPPPSGEGVDVGLMQVQAPKLASRTRRACLSSRR
jgi:hypothetical protein